MTNLPASGGPEFERDQIARDLRASVVRRDALEKRVRELSLEASRARRDAETAEQRAGELERALSAAHSERDGAAASRDDDRVRQLERERRELLAELIDARSEVERRSAQLLELRAGRWHQLAGTTWNLRRSRPRLAGFAGGLALTLSMLILVIVAPALWFVAVPLLVVGMAGASIAVIRAHREHLVGEARWRQRLERDAARVVELGADGLSATSRNQAPSPAPATTAQRAQPVVERRLVPAPTPATPVDERWRMTATRVEPRELRVACVLDEMSYACFSPECRLNGVGRTTWREELEAQPPHLLLVESAWNGNGGAWQWAIASYPSGPEQGLPSLRAMIDWCREHGIPTVFWNKEDPVHFDRFSEAAALFDHVFTTDADRIPAYEALGSEVLRSVGALPFAAQPRLHNPVGALGTRDGRPAFAGTYYRTRHEDRRGDLEMLLDVARPFGLVIYDRTRGSESDEFGFPDRFQSQIRGRLSYQETLAAYRRHSVFLNVNSVIDSPTACSRRVFELLACGTPVVSTPARAISTLLGDAVTIAASPEEATAALERLLHDDEYRRTVSARGRRAVLGTHTYGERLWAILAAAGFDLPEQRRSDVTALAIVTDGSAFRAVAEGIGAQRVAPEEVLVGAPADAAVDEALEVLRRALPQAKVRLVHQERAAGASERMRELATIASTTWVAPFATDRAYDAGHLEALLACTRFGDAEAIGAEPAAAGDPHTFVDALLPPAAIARRDAVAGWGWPDASDGLRTWFRRGARLYLAEGAGATAASGAPEQAAERPAP